MNGSYRSSNCWGSLPPYVCLSLLQNDWEINKGVDSRNKRSTSWNGGGN